MSEVEIFDEKFRQRSMAFNNPEGEDIELDQ